MSLTELLEEVEKLTPAEKEKVRLLLDDSAPVVSELSLPEKEELFIQELYKKGLLKSIPTRRREKRVSRPVKIKGKPLSETIIEERR